MNTQMEPSTPQTERNHNPLVVDTASQKHKQIVLTDAKQMMDIGKGCDIEALKLVGELVEGLPHEDPNIIFDTLSHHLRGCPSDNENLINKENQDAAVFSLWGLGRILQAFPESAFEKKVVKQWKYISQWLSFFKDKKSGSSASRFAMVVFLGASIHFPIIRMQVCMDFGLRQLVASMLFDDQLSKLDTRAYAFHIFVECCKVSAEVKKDIIFEILKTNPDFDHAVESLLRRIGSTRNMTPIPYHTVNSFIHALVYICDSSDGPFGRNPIQAQLYLSHHEPSDLKPVWLSIDNFFRLINYLLGQRYGEPFLRLSLSSGLIRALIILAPALHQCPLDNIRESISILLTKTIAIYLLSPSGINIISRALDEALEDFTQEDLEKVWGSPIGQVWKIFVSYTRERSAYRKFYLKKVDTVPPMNFCNNEKCNKPDKKSCFKTVSWLGQGHKHRCACARIREKIKRDKKDDDFVLYCARRDVFRHYPGIKDMLSRIVTTLPRYAFGIGVNYEQIPPRFDCQKFQAFYSKTDDVTLKNLMESVGDFTERTWDDERSSAERAEREARYLAQNATRKGNNDDTANREVSECSGDSSNQGEEEEDNEEEDSDEEDSDEEDSDEEDSDEENDDVVVFLDMRERHLIFIEMPENAPTETLIGVIRLSGLEKFKVPRNQRPSPEEMEAYRINRIAGTTVLGDPLRTAKFDKVDAYLYKLQKKEDPATIDNPEQKEAAKKVKGTIEAPDISEPKVTSVLKRKLDDAENKDQEGPVTKRGRKGPRGGNSRGGKSRGRGRGKRS
ncbi:hypothetical protein PNOK_0390000 [Pyrrhoderma noxium]|uniref:Uncharacterized protein n=1 Tax=Pyrrhoderma noxium TaxID=2282107 RepID=A0A286UNV6_9AGAM|nr:hypothetical protein PNOK_0390000 [Pyrrhoderma noxium]